MNFKVFQCYMYVCNKVGLIPSWEGLERFWLFYLWESEKIGRY